ncbi:hypothetical protein OIU85_012483 [Salix viminalis]|uniref:Uncharacterized protein n=1 Tax=Salix viminalis TaxID=40686 RepID=A0A9Q0SDZ7_SALVM|nr:hypothetical protein OIU85_012483 [Salix viminalis]
MGSKFGEKVRESSKVMNFEYNLRIIGLNSQVVKVDLLSLVMIELSNRLETMVMTCFPIQELQSRLELDRGQSNHGRANLWIYFETCKIPSHFQAWRKMRLV